VVTVLHDLEVVREYFPTTLLLSRRLVDQGPTREVLTAENLLKARQLTEAFDDRAPICAVHTSHAA